MVLRRRERTYESMEGRSLTRRLTKRRSLRLPRRAECAFPSRRRSGGVGRNPPRQPAGHYGEWPNWANVLEQPPARLRGGCAGARRPRPAGPTARKGAVWTEGLAEGAPRVRPGHYQAASCGLRRCRELRVRSPARVPLSKGSMGIPSSCLAARQQGIGCSEC